MIIPYAIVGWFSWWSSSLIMIREGTRQTETMRCDDDQMNELDLDYSRHLLWVCVRWWQSNGQTRKLRPRSSYLRWSFVWLLFFSSCSRIEALFQSNEFSSVGLNKICNKNDWNFHCGIALNVMTDWLTTYGSRSVAGNCCAWSHLKEATGNNFRCTPSYQ